jgi:hypothetical protein
VAAQPTAAEAIVGRVREALGSADLDALGQLLDPKVRWGAPGAPAPSCRNRRQVLAWYQRGREAGVRAQVIETEVAGDRILVGLMVSGRPVTEGSGPEANRWQVLRVGDQGIVEINGFDSRAEAAAHAGGGLAP